MTRALDHAERSPPAGVYGGSLARLSCHCAARPLPGAAGRRIDRAECGLIFRDLDIEVANQARPPFPQVFAQVREQRRPVAIIVAACIP